jgi:hypothetical protein
MDADFVNPDIVREIFPDKPRAAAAGQNVNLHILIACILVEKALMSVACSTAYGRKFIIKH